MFSRAIGAITVVLLTASTGFAADCGALQKKMVDIVSKYDDFRAKSNSQYVMCLFKGTDDKSVRSLAATFNSIQSQVAGADLAGLEKCLTLSGNIEGFLENVAKQAGDSFGKTIVTCTEKAQKILNDAKLSDQEKISQVTQVVTDYMK